MKLFTIRALCAFCAFAFTLTGSSQILSTGESAPHPQVRVDSIDPSAGVLTYAWLDGSGSPVDSGGSIARFAPLDDIDLDGVADTPTDAQLVAAILAPDPAPPVPASVSRRQLKQWLITAGLIDEVEAALNAIADPTQKALALNWWTESQEFERTHPLVAALAAAPSIGMTDAEVDQAFREAAAL